jgi:hypothetical protein
MQYYQDISENVTQLDIYTTAKKVIYSVAIPQINANQVLQMTAAFEATNPYTYNVMIGSAIFLSDSATSTAGIILDPGNAYNITPGNHHGVVVKARNWQAPFSYINKFVNVVAWAASVNASPGHMLTIEQQYGHLDVYIA